VTPSRPADTYISRRNVAHSKESRELIIGARHLCRYIVVCVCVFSFVFACVTEEKLLVVQCLTNSWSRYPFIYYLCVRGGRKVKSERYGRTRPKRIHAAVEINKKKKYVYVIRVKWANHRTCKFATAEDRDTREHEISRLCYLLCNVETLETLLVIWYV